jgi:opacity protein-like surface antigen
VHNLKFLGLATLLLASLTACAQSTAPAGEVYGGYQYTRLDTTAVQDAINLAAFEAGVPTVKFGRHQNLNGWSLGLQENLNSWFGGVVDVSGTYVAKRVLLAQSGGVNFTLRARLHSYTLMAGPQFTLRRSSTFQPFARALVGGGFFNESVNVLANNVAQFPEAKDDDRNWAFGAGAGTDVNFSSILAIRVAADYIHTQLFDDNQNNLRGTVFLVFRWGSAKK